MLPLLASLAVLLLCVSLISPLLLRAGWIRFKSKGKESKRPARTMVVLGSGGHTAEMMVLVSGLDTEKYGPVHWVKAETDSTSLPRLERDAKAPQASGLLKAKEQTFHVIPRSREVGQGWVSSVLTTLVALKAAIRLVMDVRPDVVIVNGPGTCVPIVIGCVLRRTMYAEGFPKIVFVESFCRVDSLSLTGRLLYPVADRFIIQWPKLKERYPRAEYLGVVF